MPTAILDPLYKGDTIEQEWPVPSNDSLRVTFHIIHNGEGRDHHVVKADWNIPITYELMMETLADYKDMYGDIP